MRPRKPINRNLPVNLYKNGRYFQYRNPKTGRYHGMGTDRATAIRAAHHLNAQLIEPISLTERVLANTNAGKISNSSEPRLTTWLDTYSKILDTKGLSSNTRYQRHRQVEKLRETLGNLELSSVTTRHVAEFLDTQTPRQANTFRSLLNDCFNEAIAKGLLASNPVTVTKKRRVTTHRQRLTLDDFRLIHQNSPIHLQNALDLALITLQRREDIVSFSWADYRSGVLEVQQQKTGARLRITVTEPLQRVLDSCRSEIDSPWIVHYRKNNAQSKAGDPLSKGRLSMAFQRVRDSLGLYAELPVRARPSFHEIRSLGARLYEAKGVDPQALLGHKSRKMTEVYLDSRSQEWTTATPTADILE